MKSMFLKARKLSLIASNPHILTCQSKYLFILSHMRSRSTVLSHVLGSNPGVCGYSELHRRYLNRFDLVKMRADLYEECRCKLSNKYLLDKILHDDCSISDEVLALAQPKVIFLLREPEATLKSIINMGYRTGVSWYKDPEQAADYYCKRLGTLQSYARKLGDDYLLIDADELVERTDEVLDHISSWLQLSQALDKNYSRFKNTGKRHYGDSSDNIRAGVIKKTDGHPSLVLPPTVLQRARIAYNQCRYTLLARNAGAGGRAKRSA